MGLTRFETAEHASSDRALLAQSRGWQSGERNYWGAGAVTSGNYRESSRCKVVCMNSGNKWQGGPEQMYLL